MSQHQQPEIKGSNAREERFLKATSRFNESHKSGPVSPSERTKEQGYLEKKWENVRADIEAGKREAWSLVSTRPFDTHKQQYTYKVRGDELTLTDKDGRVISHKKDERLKRYDGVTPVGVVCRY